MTNVELLREKINASGLKITFIAEKCGITYQAFLNRLKGNVEFRMDETRTLTELLGLSEAEVMEIFFTKNVI